MNKKILLVVAAVLIGLGLFKPNLSNISIGNGKVNVDEIVVVTPPSDSKLREVCGPVIDALRGGPSSRSQDGKRLANLYMDIARLVELDGEDMVIKNTDEVRYANGLAGPMLRMDIKGKYPELAKSAQAVIVAGVGDDNVPLDKDLRAKIVESFKALAWACNEGSK